MASSNEGPVSDQLQHEAVVPQVDENPSNESVPELKPRTEMLTDPEYTGQRYVINHEDLDPSELDELELFPGGLELPPMRSPRGSLHSIYGGGGSPGSLCGSPARRESNASRGSNASTLSWTSVQALRRVAAAASRAG